MAVNEYVFSLFLGIWGWDDCDSLLSVCIVLFCVFFSLRIDRRDSRSWMPEEKRRFWEDVWK